MKNVFVFICLLGLIACSDTEYYKIRFENVDRLMTGDKVWIMGLEVGEVKDLTIDRNQRVLATISINRDIRLTRGSTFTIHSDVLGTRYIVINLSDRNELLNSDEIQIGKIQPPDTTGSRKISKEEYDSLVRHDPKFKLADSIIKILSRVKENLGKRKVKD